MPDDGGGGIGFHHGMQGVCHPQIWEHDLGQLHVLVQRGTIAEGDLIEVRRYKGTGFNKRPTTDGPYRVSDLMAAVRAGRPYNSCPQA